MHCERVMMAVVVVIGRRIIEAGGFESSAALAVALTPMLPLLDPASDDTSATAALTASLQQSRRIICEILDAVSAAIGL